MSHSTSRKAARDATLPLEHRASHARSCAIHVANRLGMKRNDLIDLVEEQTGISLHDPGSAERLEMAFEHMERME